MPETMTITTYSAAELEGSAFDHAFHEFCSNVEFSWASEWEQSLNAFADHFSLQVMDWEINGVTGPSFCRLESLIQDLNEMSPVRLWKYLHNSGLLDNLLDGQCPYTGYCGDENLLDPLRDFVKQPDRDWETLINDCASAWASAHQNDMEHHCSHENFMDMSEANEWRYDENGRLV